MGREDAALLARARAVIPNGVFGHRRSFAFTATQMRTIPEDYPHFVVGARGCRFSDADGRRYVDYLCGYGPMVSGYARAEVDAAFAAQQGRGVCHSLPSPVEVALAEALVARHPGMAWSACSQSGTDAIDVAIAVARAHTGRAALVVAHGAWHGNHVNLAFGAGRVAQEQGQVRRIDWGDLAALGEALAREPVAAVVLCPYDQQVGAANLLPPAGHWAQVRALCDRHGAALVLDDIRAGFRLDPRGSAAHFGISPDLHCLSKALANGYPVAATLGAPGMLAAAERVFVSGTFWGLAPALAAALANLELLDAAACAHMAAMGTRLCAGLQGLAAARGLELAISGPPALPLVGFVGDREHALACDFCEAMARRGVLLHPTHNWFLSLAHTAGDIDETLEHAEAVLAALPAGR